MKTLRFAGLCLAAGLFLISGCEQSTDGTQTGDEKIVISVADVATLALIQEGLDQDSAVSKTLLKDILGLRDASAGLSVNFYAEQAKLNKGSMAPAAVMAPAALISATKLGLCCPCPPSSRTCPCTTLRTYVAEQSSKVEMALVPEGNPEGTKNFKSSTLDEGLTEFTMPEGIQKGKHKLLIKGVFEGVGRQSFTLRVEVDDNDSLRRAP